MHALINADLNDTPSPCPTPLLQSLHDAAMPVPDLDEWATVWICLRGTIAVETADGPFVLHRREMLTLPAGTTPNLMPAYSGLGLLVAIPAQAFGRVLRAPAGRGGLQHPPFAMRFRAPTRMLANAIECLRHQQDWDDRWRTFQAIQLMHAAIAAQPNIKEWLARAPGRTDAHRRIVLHRLLHARNRVLNCPFEEHDIVSLAIASRYSKSHFIKAFRDTFGETPGALHAATRIAMAKQLMTTNDGLSLGEIASGVGYGSRCAFSRSFKTHVGVNASVFRKQSPRPRASDRLRAEA